MPAAGSAPWWQPRAVLHRFVSDLVADELQRQRRGPLERPMPWPADLDLVRDLGVDSLELLALATALSEALHLHASGLEDWLLARRRLGDWVEIAEASLAQFSAALTFRTSGSSGLPKPCVHPLANLQQEVAHLATLFPQRRRVLCAVPGHHIYGFLFSVLLPAALGQPALEVVDLRGSTPAWLARGAQPGDLVIAHPDFWQAVARTVPRLPEDVVGVTSTAPCPDVVSEAVLHTGLARLVQVYGASETAGIGWRTSHTQPYALMPHWSFAEGQGALQRSLPDGTAQVFTLQDQLTHVGERAFTVGGRNDQAVQVGGINVFPARVRDVLCRHPAVADAAVRLMRPEEGARLKAFVVPRGDLDPDEVRRLVRSLVDGELATAERPKAISIGASLPRNAQGKLADWNI
ncbi:4-coumarate--CoA ligase [Ramlibacter sp. XY19]|uniref:4-coumarate--CoA ligase n=1 Tax=Ramlibacter paludis TaxID=2908000 RepID=UPI0023DB7428|nr:4-coumarate--CoA ligase [Ramlibacter paludis]MCG2594966.1 4-coumarate--CoA ligase [Ramlibacter paludis]